MRTFSFHIALLLCFVGLLWPPRHAAAQDRNPENAVLPDLAPQEVEIRGELQISFPSLRRQPLAGFNPPPRVPDIPTSRRPFAAPYKQRRADLPASPLPTPEAPSASLYADGPRYRGRVEGGAGAGSATSGYLEADVLLLETPRSSLTLNGHGRALRGWESAGRTPGLFGADSLALEDRVNQGAVGGQYVRRFGSQTFTARARGAWYAYRDYTRPLTSDVIDRELFGFQSRFALENYASSPVHYRVGAKAFGNRFSPDSLEAAVSNRVQVDALLGIRIGDMRLLSRSEVSGVSESVIGSDQLSTLESALGARFALGPRMRLTAGAALLSVRSEISSSGASPVQKWTYLTPEFKLEWALARGFRLELENAPQVIETDLGALLESGPYAAPLLSSGSGALTAAPLMAVCSSPAAPPESCRPDLEAELVPVNAAIRLSGTLGKVRWAAEGTLAESPNRRYFSSEPAGAAAPYLITSHDQVREMGLRLRAEAVIVRGIQIHGRLGLQDAKLIDQAGDPDVPHYAPWDLEGGLSVAFDGDKGLIQVTGRVLGARPADTSALNEAETYADLDIRFGYYVTPSAGLHVRLLNLAGSHERWYGFDEPVGLLQGGLSWRW